MQKLLALLLLLAPLVANAADDSMLYVEYRFTGKDVPANSFDAQVKKVWRVGDTLLRFEDAPNPETKEHVLTIVSEPNIWVIDRNTNKGQHVVDPGPSFRVHFPLLASEQSNKIRELEFGDELEYFRKNGARELAPQEIEGSLVKPLKLTIDDRDMTLYVKSDDTPFQIVVKSANYDYTMRFVRYERNRKVDKSLFNPPSDVRIKG